MGQAQVLSTAYGKIGYKLDSRLSITFPILVRIMKGLDIFCVSQYELFMF